MKKKKLQLLGIWNELPYEEWVWHCDDAKKHFFKLTGHYIKTFTYLENELHYISFLPRAVSSLKSDFLILVYNTLNKHGIQIPFPQLDLHVKHMPK